MDGYTGLGVGILVGLVLAAVLRVLYRALFGIRFAGGANVSQVNANCMMGIMNMAQVTATANPNKGCTITGVYAIGYASSVTPPANYPGGGFFVNNGAPVVSAPFNTGNFTVPVPGGVGQVIVAVWPEYKTTDTYQISQTFGPCTM